MVSTALRSYINDIGDMIDHQQIAESIAHCRHILETYPKHVDTYRLLGKAYLEEKRYGDASDILQRVLSSIPEDFIAHVGMSIIREDEGNLDAAIYHMERAFETQPSNHAIQDELRRLHANRDGVEPPRIRLTRGALARMYAHGQLFDQTIAELLAAISEDAQRYDLQTLLAEMYFQTGKKVDSAETCTKILEKLPYCLKANQLLTIILEENDRAEDALRYRQRWEALDPYAAFTNQANTNPETAPESKVQIERLQWEPEAYFESEEDQPAWASSLGVSFGKEKESDKDMPAWLSSETTEDSGDSFDSDQDEDEFLDDFFASDKDEDDRFFDDLDSEPAPEDWLRDTDEHDDVGLFGGESLESEAADEAEDDFDLFESLKKPTAGLDQPLSDIFAEEEADDDDWMAEFSVPPTDSLADKDETLDMQGDWLASLSAAEEETDSAEQEESETADDDWLTAFDTEEEEPAALADEPETDGEDDWLASLGAAEEEEESETADDDWLTAFDTEEEEPAALADEPETDGEDDWLASLGAAEEEEETDSAEQEEPETADDDWLTAFDAEEEEPAALADEPETDQEDDWLASLGAAEEKEEPETADDDWLTAFDTEEEEPAALADEPETDQEDDWLASLGTAEGEEEPAAEEVELPDFLKEAGWEKAPSDADDTADIEYQTEEDLPDELEQAEIPDWIQDMAPTEDQEPSPTPSDVVAEADPEWLDEMEQQPTTPTPDWLSELDETEAQPPTEPEPEEPALGQEIQADDLDMAWLESLAAKQGIPDEELVTSPEQRADATERHLTEETQPEADFQEEEAEDDWLATLGEDEDVTSEDTDWSADREDQPETVEAESSPVLEDEDDFDMDWLAEIGQQAAEEAADSSLEAAPLSTAEDELDVDDWLTGLKSQPEAPARPETEAPFEESAPVSDEDTETDADWLTQLEVQPKAPAEEAQTVLEDEDDFDMDWLDEIGQQAAEEAAEPAPETAPPAEIGDEPAADDWLADLGQPQEDTETDADWLTQLEEQTETPAEEAQAVLEDEDDFDMDWLDEIGQQAAEEAAEPAPEVEDEPAGDDWLAGLAQPGESAETDADWLTQLEDQPEAPAEEPQAVLEDEDDFDMDWLGEIGQQAAEEAAEPAPEVEDEPAGDDWLAGLAEPEENAETDANWLTQPEDQPETNAEDTPPPPGEEPEVESEEGAWLAKLADQEQEAESDWLTEVDSQPDAPTSDFVDSLEEKEALTPVEEADDDFDTGWLKSIGEEAAAEAAATSIEASPTDEDQPEEDTPAWLSDVGSEFDSEQPLGDDTMGRFLSGLDQTEEAAESDVADFLTGLDHDENTPAEQVEVEDIVPSPEQDLEDFPMEDLVETDQPTDEDHLAAGDWDEFQMDSEPPSTEESQQEDLLQEEAPEQTSAWTDEWQPEDQAEEQPTAPAEVSPQASDPESPQSILEAASQAADKGELSEALKGFSTLIKKGKLVEEVIQQISETLRRHPVNVELWQALGDAYMRIDDLQEALDAYTKAEELLR